jgi:sigma-B regulation protein RsbU (phosphoserine phosphatase)
MNKNFKILFSSLAIITLSVIVIVLLNKKVNPYAQISYNISVDSVKSLTLKILHEQNIIVNKQNVAVGLAANKNLVRYVQNKYGLDKSREKFVDEIPGYYWNVSILKDDKFPNFFSNDKEKIAKAILGHIRLSFTLSGSLINYEINIDDTTKNNLLTYNQAYIKAKSFLEKYTKFNISNLDTANYNDPKTKEKTISLSLSPNGIESNVTVKKIETKMGNYFFEGKTYNSDLDDSIKIKVGLFGNHITGFSLNSDKIEKIPEDNSQVIFEVISIAVYFIALIGIIIAAFKRYRAYEIGFRTAIIIGFIGGFAVILSFMFAKMPGGWEILLPIIFGFLVSFGGYIIVTAVGESYTREIWNEKLISLDLITNGYFFHNKIGKAILRGLSFGFGATALYLIFLYLFSLISNYSIVAIKDEIFLDNQLSKLFYPVVKSINIILFPILIIFLVIGTYVKSRTKNNFYFIIISSFVYSLLLHDSAIPVYQSITINFVIGIIFSLLMLKFDFLTISISLFISYSSILIFWFALLPDNAFIFQLLGIALILIYGVFALFSKYRLEDLNEITPKFQKHISERQRLQGELAVARDVQKSFLPQHSPNFEGLEIVAKCLPAYEVGGDYYDFIKFSDTNVGIAIGDVSGKGTKAAFYMTLTKGFLKATSRFNTSPALLLSDMNAMFYENVERGNFISMIFATIDIKNKLLVFSRAGHNPLLLKRKNNNVEILKPQGIALGLEKGDVFNKTITEQSIVLNSDDYIIMFTDGITEAENNKAEEYGLERLINIINSENYKSAEELLSQVYKDVLIFTGKTHQHDDMTLIVIKVL